MRSKIKLVAAVVTSTLLLSILGLVGYLMGEERRSLAAGDELARLVENMARGQSQSTVNVIDERKLLQGCISQSTTVKLVHSSSLKNRFDFAIGCASGQNIRATAMRERSGLISIYLGVL